MREQWAATPPGIRGIVLTLDRATLSARIDQRTAAMFADGVIDEVRACGDTSPTAGQTLGLREIRTHLAGEITRADCIAAIQLATRRYAKRQMTWFRRETFLEPTDVASISDLGQLAEPLARQAACQPYNP